VSPIDANALPSQAELDELTQLATHTGASLEQLMHFRATILQAAAGKIRAEKGSGTYEPGVYFRSGMDYAADLIDPQTRP